MDDLQKMRKKRELEKMGYRGELVSWATPPDALLPYMVKCDTLMNSVTRQMGVHHVLMLAPPNGEAGWALTPDQIDEYVIYLQQFAEQARKLDGG